MDKGCEGECAGKKWTDEFISRLSKEDQAKVEKIHDSQRFKFGDGQVSCSLYTVKCPVYIAGTRLFMAWSVLDLDLPLLMSLPVMQRLQLTVRYSSVQGQVNDHGWVMGKKIKFQNIDGHQWMSIDKEGSLKAVIKEEGCPLDSETETQEVLLLSGKIDKNNILPQVKKLHLNFAHLSGLQMQQILKDCGKWSKEAELAVDKVLQQCENLECRRKGNVTRAPVSNFRVVKAPGELVAIDLKIRHNKKPILYLVDHCTGFCTAAVINNKSAEAAAQGVWEAWYRSGMPIIRTLMSDNGREFVGQEFQKFLERFGTKHITTAPYNPQSNGKCERIHYIIDNNIRDLMVSFPDLDEKDALCWALTAYNNVETKQGFSPSHLLYGVPQGETQVADMGLGDCLGEEEDLRYINMLKLRLESRLNHQKIKADEKFKRFVLRKSVPSPAEKPLGTWVWVVRDGQPIRGPGMVGKSLSSVIAVKTATGWIDCRHNECIPLNEAELKKYAYLCRNQEPEEPVITHRNHPDNAYLTLEFNRTYREAEVSNAEDKTPVRPVRSVGRKSTRPPQNPQRNPSDEEMFQREQRRAEKRKLESPPTPAEASSEDELREDDSEISFPPAAARDDVIEISSSPDTTREEDRSEDSSIEIDDSEMSESVPEDSDVPEDSSQDTEVSAENTIDPEESQAPGPEIFLPTAKGRFKPGENLDIYVENQWRSIQIKNCYRKNPKNNSGTKYNVVFSDSDSKKSYLYDLDQIAWRQSEVSMDTVEPSKVRLMSKEKSDVLVTTIPYHQHGQKEVIEAKQKELEKLKSFGAFVEVKRSSLTEEQKSKMVSTTWTVVHKPQGNNGEGLVKARLCARGDREEGIFRTDSPTCSKGSLRLGLAIAASKGWKINSLDFTSAFIQGQDIERELYFFPPPRI